MAVTFPFKINGQVMPCPSSAKVKIADLSGENSGRALDGTMSISYIGTKRTIPLEFIKLPLDQSQKLINAMKADVFMEVTYVDPQYGETTKTFYSSDIDNDMIYVNGQPFWDISFDFIQQ